MLISLPYFIVRGTGLQFVGRNFSIAMNEQIVSPIGFNITFPGLLSLAIGMGLSIPIRQTDIEAILQLREAEMKRSVYNSLNARIKIYVYISFV